MKQDTHTSSPGRLVALGEIVGTHGVRGLLRFRPYDLASKGLPTDRSVYLTTTADPDPATARAIVLDTVRPHGRVELLGIRGVDDIDTAMPYIGSVVSVPERDLPTPDPGEYYVYQLAGLAVVTDTGERLGTIERSFSTGANEVLVVQEGTREYLIPMIADVVRSIDVAGGRVVIDPIPGLLDA